MKSFAVIDRIEGKYVACEVEMLNFQLSRPEDFNSKETEMIDISLDEIINSVGIVEESDILVVEHNGEEIQFVYYKDDNEKVKRIKFLQNILN